MTYSIVALDKNTGELGVAVQSHWFNSGGNVPLVEGQVGAVAIQALGGPHLAPPIMELLRQGKSAQEALARVIATDPLKDARQAAVVDDRGDVAAHTGPQCISVAGHEIGDGFSVQANIMINDSVVPAMATAFRNAEGTLAQRMLEALEAAEAAGGDLRGRQSAGLIVEHRSRDPRQRISLHVADHPEPIKELRRILNINTAYVLMNDGDSAIAAGEADQAIELYNRAMNLVPDNLECRYWYAITLLNIGRDADGNKVLREIYDTDERWKELTPRLLACGLLDCTAKLLE